MYLYFNSKGELKEVINNDAFRQTNTRNKIYIHVEGTVATSCTAKFRIPSGVLPLFYPPLVVVRQKIPYNPKQDLKYFNYRDEFNFIEIPTVWTANGEQYNALAEAGTVNLTVRINGQALGLIVFNVEESADGNNIQYDQYISLAQFYYLLELIENIGGGGEGPTGNYVTLDTEQTIDAKKYFRFLDAFLNTFHLRAGDNETADRFTFGYTQNGELKKALQIFSEVYNGISGFGVNFNWKFPYKSGTIALLDDVPTLPENIVTTDTNQDNITGNKTFKGDVTIDAAGSLKIYKTPVNSQDAATKGYVDGLITGSVHFKGTVADMTALNAIQNPVQGDEYWVTSESQYYIWNGSLWSAAGGGVDLSDYSTTVQMNAAIAAAAPYVISRTDGTSLSSQEITDLINNKAVLKYNGYIYKPSFEDSQILELRTNIIGGQKRIIVGKSAGSWSERTEWDTSLYSVAEYTLSDNISSVWFNTIGNGNTSNRLCYFTIKDTNLSSYNGSYFGVITGSAPNYKWIITDLQRGYTYSGTGAQTFSNIFSNTYRIINPYELPGYVFTLTENIQDLADQFAGKFIVFKYFTNNKMYSFTANSTDFFITDLSNGDVYSAGISSIILRDVIDNLDYLQNKTLPCLEIADRSTTTLADLPNRQGFIMRVVIRGSQHDFLSYVITTNENSYFMFKDLSVNEWYKGYIASNSNLNSVIGDSVITYNHVLSTEALPYYTISANTMVKTLYDKYGNGKTFIARYNDNYYLIKINYDSSYPFYILDIMDMFNWKKQHTQAAYEGTNTLKSIIDGEYGLTDLQNMFLPVYHLADSTTLATLYNTCGGKPCIVHIQNSPNEGWYQCSISIVGSQYSITLRKWNATTQRYSSGNTLLDGSTTLRTFLGGTGLPINYLVQDLTDYLHTLTLHYDDNGTDRSFNIYVISNSKTSFNVDNTNWYKHFYYISQAFKYNVKIQSDGITYEIVNSSGITQYYNGNGYSMKVGNMQYFNSSRFIYITSIAPNMAPQMEFCEEDTIDLSTGKKNPRTGINTVNITSVTDSVTTI